MPQRPEPPGKVSSMVRTGSPSREPPRPSSAAVKPSKRSGGRARRRSPARLTRRNLFSLSKVKMATSISSMTVRRSAPASRAPRRCSRSVSLRELTSIMTSPMASSRRGGGGGAGAHGEILFAHGGEEIGKSLQGKGHAMAHGNREAEPQTDDEQAQSPDGARGKITGPEQNHGDERARESGRDGQKQDAMF